MDSCEYAQTARCRWEKQTFVLPSQRCNLAEEAELLRGQSEFGVHVCSRCRGNGIFMFGLGARDCCLERKMDG